MGLWLIIREYVIPTIFVTVFPFFSLAFVAFPRYEVAEIVKLYNFNVLNNCFAWSVVIVWAFWCAIFLKFTRTEYHGPTTTYGETPVYAANGMTFYLTTMSAFTLLNGAYPEISVGIYDNLVSIIAVSNLLAQILCVFLCYSGYKYPMEPERERGPLVMEYFRGINMHPKYFGIDVKQFTNCRYGVMGWQMLVVAFYVASLMRNGFNVGITVNVVLQSIYLAKFFYWETGYFNTLDIILDRAGFYLCWGCMVFVLGLYTHSTNYMVANPASENLVFSISVLFLGITCIILNYKVDHEKEEFRNSDGKCLIWGKKPTFIQAEYKDAQGIVRKSKLLTSGFWGVSRHINYVFELGCCFCWAVVGYERGIVPFLYVIYLTILLVHRIYRDEDKCSHKYKKYWKTYCMQVKYRLIPYVY